MRGSPGVGLSFERREAFTAHVMERLSQRGEAVPMREVAADLRAQWGMGLGYRPDLGGGESGSER